MATEPILDLAVLLAPIPGADPAGNDVRLGDSPSSIYYAIKDARSAAREIEKAIANRPGGAGEGGPTPDIEWRKIRSQAPKLLTNQAKDFEVVMWLTEALLRNVRFVVALGEHTGGMSTKDAEQLFVTRAFLDEGNAKQQAARGTFDPMYLAYTVGKLAILKMRTDWKVKHPNGTLQEFHDEFLAHGAAPLPVIRRAMLGDDSVL